MSYISIERLLLFIKMNDKNGTGIDCFPEAKFWNDDPNLVYLGKLCRIDQGTETIYVSYVGKRFKNCQIVDYRWHNYFQLENPKRGIYNLPELILKVIEKRNWSKHWDSRLAAQILESSEFVEAARGKTGNKVEEAGDVLFTTIALLITNGVSLQEACNAAFDKVEKLLNIPKYEGEETLTVSGEVD